MDIRETNRSLEIKSTQMFKSFFTGMIFLNIQIHILPQLFLAEMQHLQFVLHQVEIPQHLIGNVYYVIRLYVGGADGLDRLVDRRGGLNDRWVM